MEKHEINPDVWPLIEPVIIIGTEIDGRPNFLTCSWHSRVNQKPPYWGITIDVRRYSLSGIKRNMSFSINVPDKTLVKKADFVGIYSGKKEDKSSVFTVFNGKLKGAPMIEECPINIELEVRKIVDFETDSLIVGEAMNAVCDTRLINNDEIDFEKSGSFFLSYPDFYYRTMSENIGKAWNIGKKR